MKIKCFVLTAFFLMEVPVVHAQQISFKDTIASYRLHKININRTGMKVLGAWGIANIAGGSIGYFTAKQDELKYFSEMTAAWGVVNTTVAAISLAGVRKEMAAKMDYEQSYRSYLDNKRLFLINAGLAVVYIGAGVGLTAYSQNGSSNKPLYGGFGKSIVLQGVFLLLFDNIMFSAHQLDNTKWFQIMNEIHFTGNGVGFNHSF